MVIYVGCQQGMHEPICFCENIISKRIKDNVKLGMSVMVAVYEVRDRFYDCIRLRYGWVWAIKYDNDGNRWRLSMRGSKKNIK